MDIIVLGVSGLLIVKYVVNALKTAGLSSKLALPAAVLIGLALAVCSQFGAQSPVFQVWFEKVLTGLFMGLGAAEVYNAGSIANRTLDIRQAELELKTA
jgi:hypothetical protein